MSYYSDLDNDLGADEEAREFNKGMHFQRTQKTKSSKVNIATVGLENRFPSRGEAQTMKCHCGVVYQARKSDLKRGWALSCSKSCASLRRAHGKPKAIKCEVSV
jgi:hypothetical protein